MKRYRHLTWFAMFLSILFIIGDGIVEAQGDKTEIKGRIAFDFPNAPEAKIEVNLSGKLFSLFAKSTKQEPQIAELVAMVDGAYVRGYDSQLAGLNQMIRYYEDKLKKADWEVIAKVKEENESVQVRMLLDQDTVHGIFVMVTGAEETIFVNIFGHIDFEKLGELLGNLDKMNLDLNLPQLKNLKIEGESKQNPEDK